MKFVISLFFFHVFGKTELNLRNRNSDDFPESEGMISDDFPESEGIISGGIEIASVKERGVSGSIPNLLMCILQAKYKSQSDLELQLYLHKF